MDRVGFPATEGITGLPLTAREQEVLDLLRTGMMRAAAAEQLGMAEETLKTHIKSCFGKLGARNTAGAFARLEERKVRLLCSQLEELTFSTLTSDESISRSVLAKLLSFIDREEITTAVSTLLDPSFLSAPISTLLI